MQGCQRREKQPGKAVENRGEQVWLLTLSNAQTTSMEISH